MLTGTIRPALLVLILGAAGLGSPRIAAQGIAGASVEGVAVDSTGRPVSGADIIVRHGATGAEYRTTTDVAGRFRLDVVPVRGPFVLQARAIGRPPLPPQSLLLAIGDRVHRRLVFGGEQAIGLADVTVREQAIPVDVGPGFAIPGDGIRGLPLFNRDFTGLFAAAPQALGRTLNSISGQHPGYNAIQIDGAIASDLYGVGRTPGSQAGAKSISLEALAGLRVLIAPFDVRQGGFSGGLIEAVTRSGTSQFEGELFTSMQRPFLVGRDTAGRGVTTFDKLQYGLTLGGPIVADRLHYFVAVDLQHSATPFVGPEAGAPGTGISDSTAQRAAEVFRNVYGFDPGTTDSPVIQQPDRDLFAKLSWHPGPDRHVELSHNWVTAADDDFNREVRDRLNRDGWQLSGSGAQLRADIHATRLRGWIAGRHWTQELLAGYRTIREQRHSNLDVPLFLVEADQSGTYLAAGSVVSAQGTILDQDLLELADDLTWSTGSHRVTIGARAELSHFTDNLFLNAWGVWRFPSVDALETRLPDRYEANLPLRDGGPVADFGARTVSGYLQDRWTPTRRITMTAGIRVDAPFLDRPPTNPVLAASDALGRLDTGDFPTGNALIAPRLSFSYDLSGDWHTVLRIGAGVFSGQPPFAWLGGAYSNTGLDQQSLICNPLDGVPAPVTDPAQRPAQCLVTAGRPTPPSNVVTFAPGFRFPQATKLLIGLDRSIGAGIVASLDLVSTTTRHAAFLSDVNLTPGASTSEGRVMYGEVNAIGVAVANRPDPTHFRQVLRYNTRSGDRSRAMMLSVQRHWTGGAYLQLGWQWSHAEDVFTINRISANLTLQATPIDGSMADRRRTRSGYDVPQSLTLNGVVPVGRGFSIAVLARHQSGRPFAYAVTGDANADGVASNDLFYVPRDASDISLTSPDQFPALNNFIESEPCLRDQRGRIMTRNSCRNPSFTTLDARLSWVATALGRRVEIGADVFNLANLLNSDWGLIRETSAGEARTGLVSVAGWDAAANRPVYRLASSGSGYLLPPRNRVLTSESRWRIQLGARVRY